MAESLLQTFGEFDLPPKTSDVAATLAPLDPARDILLNLFTVALNTELGAAWRTVTKGTPLESTEPVQDTLPLKPTPPTIRQWKGGFPILAVYRDEDFSFDEYTLQQERLTQTWGVDYVINPLDIEGQRKFTDMLIAVAKVLNLTLRRQGHPEVEGGISQFAADRAGFLSLRFVSGKLGPANFAEGGEGGAIYYACSMKLETTEVDGFADGFAGTFEGASIHLGFGSGEGEIADLINADTAVVINAPC